MHGPFRVRDPAIERFDSYRESHYMRFKWTPANFRIFLAYFVVVPGAMFAISSYSDRRWQWRGALKSEALDQKSKPAELSE